MMGYRTSLALALALVGCGSEGAGATERPAQSAPQLVGRTEDGTQIIFAGPPSTRARGQAARSEREEQRLIRTPNTPDPEAGDFTLEEAVVGLPIDGTLVAEIGTDFGVLLCDLYADRAPRTVANFVGLTRGLRPFWDARAGEWVRRPYYRGLTFHRVIPGYMVQGGDYLEDGTGTVGYTLRDEPHESLSHDRAGLLCMANHDGPSSAGAQFFLTDGAAPQLDGQGFTIFGDCRPPHVISQIARVPQDPDAGNRPRTPVRINRLFIRRVEGGAAAAEPTPPRLPEGEPEVPRGASDPPSVLRSPHTGRRYPEASSLPEGQTGPPIAPPTKLAP